MTLCPRCRLTKPEEEFGGQPYCRPCARDYKRPRRSRYNRTYRRRHPKAHRNAMRRIRQDLGDNYIKQTIAQGTKLSFADIPSVLVNAQRTLILAKRILRIK